MTTETAVNAPGDTRGGRSDAGGPAKQSGDAWTARDDGPPTLRVVYLDRLNVLGGWALGALLGVV